MAKNTYELEDVICFSLLRMLWSIWQYGFWQDRYGVDSTNITDIHSTDNSNSTDIHSRDSKDTAQKILRSMFKKNNDERKLGRFSVKVHHD